MPRPTTKTTTATKAKAPAVKKTSTPKRTPSRAKKALMRDLHSMSDLIETRMGGLGKLCQSLAGLKDKVNVISINVEEAQKEHDERVGKVERDILDYQLEEVKKVLQETNKVVIDSFEMEALKKLKKEREATEDKENKDLDGKVAERVAELVRFKEVEFQNEYAEYLAKQAAMEAERRTMQATISSLRFEIETQKGLSSDIAKANQQKKINELRRKAIEEMNAKEQAKDDAMLRSMMGGAAPVAPVPAAATPAPAAAVPPLPKPAKKPSGKKSTPLKKATPVKKPPTPEPEESDESESGTVSSETTTDEDSPVKQTQETPKLKRSGSELTRQGSQAKRKPAAKKSAKK